MLAQICLLPVLGFLVLALLGSRIPRVLAALIGCATVAGSGFLTAQHLLELNNGAITQTLGLWIAHAGGVAPEFAFKMDALSGTMAGIVCFIGLLIHIYSAEYMSHDEGHNRFFAYLNLFVGAMLTLLLADDLLLLFLGWEGVGICSYLLIGFWYSNSDNGRCAQKAVYLTRIGDVTFMIALFLLFVYGGTWSISKTLDMAWNWGADSPFAVAVAALFLIAALSKSAQFPFHVWLPDAMAGPTPVSALLHSSTMVTAGVYLVARLHPIFLQSQLVMNLIAIGGAVTALYAGITAISQTDIKRVLAYSTISQIGYMFLALGVGAFTAGIFHFLTHAFFKALLFLGAGAVIHAVHGEQNMLKLGGLRKKLPIVFATFVAGSAALAALPLITSGFYSKDYILWESYAFGHKTLWIAGIVAAVLTGWYSIRMVAYTFFGKPYQGSVHRPGMKMALPLVILAVLALISGFIETPHTLGSIHLWKDWIGGVFQSKAQYLPGIEHDELMTQIVATIAGLTGLFIGYMAWKRRDWVKSWAQDGAGQGIHQLSQTGFFIDCIYNTLFVGGFQKLSQLLKREWVDTLLNGGLSLVTGAYDAARASQSGRVRVYAMGIVLGAALLAAGALWL